MAIEKRLPATVKRNLGSGPLLAKVVSHADPSFMGGLEVTLLRDEGNKVGDINQTYVVRCATPFYGSTAFEFMGQNKADFNDTQKSYGMWFVPPDVGVTVMVLFIDGNPADGYWIACIPSRFANSMIPGIGSSENVELTDEDKKRFGSSVRLPVGEVNRRANDLSKAMNVDKIKRPYHPIADAFLEQGLLDDDIRGTTNASARRDIPGMVFGISTPGPLDRRDGAKKGSIGKNQSSSTPVPVSRLGGTQMVFDDGDDQYRRATPPATGPYKYIDTLDPAEKIKGEPTIPYGEHFRIRTRTGHQILMHNSEDLIYIGNAKGTTWIELTSNGKIDIYAQDSVSIHTETDLNVRADRDINLEAGRNVNIKAAGGQVHMEAASNYEVICGSDGKITVGANLDIKVGAASKITSGATFDLKSGGANKFTAGGSTDIKSGGNHTESAARIDMNGPPAASAATAASVSPLSTHSNPATSTTAGWGKKYQGGSISSIMKRVPMHEPWLLHENQAPQLLTPSSTDRDT